MILKYNLQQTHSEPGSLLFQALFSFREGSVAISPSRSSWWFPGSSGRAPPISRYRTAAPGSLRWPRRGRTGRSSAPRSGGPARTRGPAGCRRSWRSRRRPGPGSSSGPWSSPGAFSRAAASAWCKGQRSGTARQLGPGRGLPGKKKQKHQWAQKLYIYIPYFPDYRSHLIFS